MLTQSLYIINNQTIQQQLEPYIYQYTGLFYKLYNNKELMADPDFINDLKTRFPLFDKSMFDFCKKEVETKDKQHQTEIKNKHKLIEQFTKELNELNTKNNTIDKKGKIIKLTKKEKKYKYVLINKISRIKKNINKDIAFGGKVNLRKITKYKQLLQKEYSTTEQKQEYNILLHKFEQQYKLNRKLGIYLIGRACEDGNRKINFNLLNNKIVFKPSLGNNIEILFKKPKSPKKRQLLYTLNTLANNGEIPLTVRICQNKIDISYDEQLINGFAFDKKKYKEQLALIDKNNEQQRKDLFKRFAQEKEKRQLKNKIANRFMSFDPNPKEIGYVVGDKINDGIDGDFDLIEKGCINFKKLSKKLGLTSSDLKQIKQNNKLKYEIKEIWKELFKIAQHYKVAYFVCEDLEFKLTLKDKNGTEFNKQTKNLWHRELSKRLITKWCNIYGIIKIDVNPVYSSFIGNMIYDYYDPISASMEICRRGMVKYTKGSSLYPCLSRINQEKLNYLLGENVEQAVGLNWIQLYKLIPDANQRARNKSKQGLADVKLFSWKSKVRMYSVVKPCADVPYEV